MINLLPTEEKRQIKAARANVILMRYCALIITTAGILGAVFAAGFWAESTERNIALNAKTTAQQSLNELSTTRQAAESFATNLQTAKTIIGTNKPFNQLVLDIAALVPPGVVLNSLTLGGPATTSAVAPIDITGRATSYQNATALRTSLEQSAIFDTVTIANITQASGEQTNDGYPFVVSLKAQFNAQYAPGGN